MSAAQSNASNLVAGNNNGFYDSFLRDRPMGTTAMISVSPSGAPANGESGSPVISADGRFVVFESSASNLVAGDTNGENDIFLRPWP